MLLLALVSALVVADTPAALTEFDELVRHQHRGYAAAPEWVTDGPDGSPKQTFRTRDGWTCELSAVLKCTNEHEGKKFEAVGWRGGRERLRVHLVDGNYADLYSACDFFGYRRPTPTDFVVSP